VAVLTSNTSWCEYYQRLSQNVQDVGYCQMSNTARQSAWRVALGPPVWPR